MFTAESILFKILPDNDVHLNWILRARGFSLQYGTSNLSNQNYGYNMAPKPINIVIYEFFNLRRSFRVFISNILTIHGSSASSMAQLPVFSEPLSADQLHRLFTAEGGLYSEFLLYLQQYISQPDWNLSTFSAAHFATRSFLQIHHLVQFPDIFDYSYFSKIPVTTLPLIWHMLYVNFFRVLSTAALD